MASLLAFATVILDTRQTNRGLVAILHDLGATVGHWTLEDCERHAGRQFTFYVGDRLYHGDNGPEAADCDAVRLGAPVNVVYSGPEPSLDALPLHFAYSASMDRAAICERCPRWGPSR